MKKAAAILFLSMFCFSALAVEELILNDGVEISKKMEADEIFFKRCTDFDVDGKYLYMIALTQGRVFKVDLETGKLAKAISSLGQGPGELAFAVQITVKNGKIFVADRGFGGIKIFDLDGKLVNEFKVRGYVTTVGIEVDDRDHIYFGKPDFTGNSMVTVYDLKGRKLRSIIKYNIDPKDAMSVKKHEYRLDMDGAGNLYILFPVIRVIRKYSNDGTLIWENEIHNGLIDESPGRAYFKINDKKGTYLRRSIADFDITGKSEIVISHSWGGCLLDKDGKLKRVIKLNTDQIAGLRLIEVVGSKLYNISNYKRNVVIFDLGGYL